MSTKNSVKQLFVSIIIMLIFMSYTSYGGVIQYEDVLTRSTGDLVDGAALELEDPDRFDNQYNGAGDLMYTVDRSAYVRLVYGRADRMDIDNAVWYWDMTVEYVLEDLTTNTVYPPKTLYIEHNSTTGIYEEIGVGEHLNLSGGHIKITARYDL